MNTSFLSHHHPHHLNPPLIDHLRGNAPVFGGLEGEEDAASELIEQIVVERAFQGAGQLLPSGLVREESKLYSSSTR